MHELSPVRLTERGTLLLLSDAYGAEFVVATDARLRDTLGRALDERPRPDSTSGSSDHQPEDGARRGDGVSSASRPTGTPATPARKAVEMDLRPREIQDRIRAGESVADLATVAGAPEARVMAFAGPVLAERAYLADTALGASLRRLSDDGPAAPESARTLGAAANARLRAEGADRDALTWDAWRREDGRWTVEARYRVDGEQQRARFTYDVPGRFVSADDVEARWLVGDGAFPSRADKDRARSLRLAPPPEDRPFDREEHDDFGAALSPVGSSEGAVGEDVMAMLDDPPAPVPEISETAAAVRGARIPQQKTRHDESAPVTPARSMRVGQEDQPLDIEVVGLTEESDDWSQEREDTAALARRHPRKQRGRASVPTWDEIMFGGGADSGARTGPTP